MYAIVQVGSSQFKVTEGDVIDVKRYTGDEGKNITLDKVLLYSKGSDVRIGQPFLKDVKVSATLVKHDLDKRITVFKYRRRKNSATKNGYRSKVTQLNITKIAA